MGRDIMARVYVYAITPQTEPVDQSVIQGMFLLSRLWAKTLFDSGASSVKNIGFDEYISTWILRIYRRYIRDISVDIFT